MCFGTVLIMPAKPSPPQNHLLAALPAEVQGRLLPYLELIPLPLGKVIYESGDTLRHVYFPTDSIVSLLYVMENGAAAEISVVGNEGLVGVAVFIGGESTPSRAIEQSAGYAYRQLGQRLKDEFNRHGDMLHLMLRYTQALITQMAQTAVCNRHHSIDQQLCRWLLLSLDHLPSNQLTMTQELIANMLGVRREGVTDAAGKLQRLGVIEYSRGHIKVLDRAKLEQMSCECHAVVRAEIAHRLCRQLALTFRNCATKWTQIRIYCVLMRFKCLASTNAIESRFNYGADSVSGRIKTELHKLFRIGAAQIKERVSSHNECP